MQRLLALSFTVTFTLTAITVAMDLVGWKCAAPAVGDVCGTSWLGWLDAAWLRDRPGRQLAVTALVPLAVVGLLWWLAGATWDKLERVRPPASDTAVHPVEIETPLEDRAMWNGRGPVRRLRAVHVATGLALPGVFALAPVQADSIGRLDRPARPRRLPAGDGARRRAPHDRAPGERPSRAETSREDDDERRSPFRFLPWCALLLTVLGLAVAATGTVAGTVAGSPAPAGTVEVRSTMPWLAGALQWTFVVQAVLLALLLAACWSLKRRAGERRRRDTARSAGSASGPRGAGTPCPPSRMLAWVLAGGFSAGIVLRAADTLGTPVAPGYQGTDVYPLVVPLAYRWVAAAAFALAVTAVLSAVFVWVRLRRWKQMTTDVAQAYGARRDGGHGAHRRDRPGVGPGDAADRRGAAGARFPAGRDRGRRAGGRAPSSCSSGTAGRSTSGSCTRGTPCSARPSSGCCGWAARPTGTPHSAGPSASSGTSAPSGRGRCTRSPHRATRSAPSRT